MPPVEQQLAIPGAPPVTGGPPAPGTISLSTLIEFIIQKTYHDLTVLSELLPRKTDMERKIEIVQFASRTRQLFVRLLALVKWATSASKVDKCGVISSFLDNQAMLFVQTADALAQLSRETLVQARLPAFSIPSAVDVLTTGTYPRLPACIKDKIVPPDPITPEEKRQTLMRLNQIIEHRLVTSELPKHMRKLKIESGRVKFFIEHEFQVTLTLMGEGPTIPWRLLDIEILVEDPETGAGKALVHSLQVGYIHQLVQSRLIDNEAPLHDLYNCLHSFCQSLQLEVLHSQIQRLVHERLVDNVRVEEYSAGKSLSVSYWRESCKREGVYFPHSLYKLSIHVDEKDPSKPLQVTHYPPIQGSESIKVVQAIRSDHLSMEKLLMQTIQVRSSAKLKDLEREFRLYIKGRSEVAGTPPVLYVPVLKPCMLSEMLCVAIDILKGLFLVSIANRESNLTLEIEDNLNSRKPDIRGTLSKVRLMLAQQRCKKSIQHLPALCTDRLPIVNQQFHGLDRLSNNKLFIKIPKQTQYFLVVELVENAENSIDFKYHLLHVRPSACDNSLGENMEDAPKLFMRAGHMIQFDPTATLHGPYSRVFEYEEEEQNSLLRKRKLLLGDPSEPPVKKTKGSPYFISELTHVLAMCEDRIPFMLLSAELYKQNIGHQGIQVDGAGACLCLNIISLPPCPDISQEAQESLKESVLSCTVRMPKKPNRMFLFELTLANCPVKTTAAREQGVAHKVYFNYELSSTDKMDKVVASLLEDWNSLSNLYAAVYNFSLVYNDMKRYPLEVKMYSYKRFTLAYGANKAYTATIQWKSGENKFQMSFGTCGQTSLPNPHTQVAAQLKRELNETKSIVHIAQLLIETWSPLSSIGKLSVSPVVDIQKSLPHPNFTIIPESPTHIKVVYRNIYCVDIQCRGNQQVTVRDGAYSRFDTSGVVHKLSPAAGLKAFLNLYVDESASLSQIRRRSTTEDDNPPSPIDTFDSFMAPHQPAAGSPAAGSRPQKTDPLRFGGPSPLTPTSNPTTPASPASHLAQGVARSPLMSAPSPSTLLGVGSPGNPTNPSAPLHAASPGSLQAPSPQSMGIHLASPAAPFISPQSLVEGVGSPFPGGPGLAMPSPGARNWPASPGAGGTGTRLGVAQSPGHPALHSPPTQATHPIRILPQRSWAASIPTLLSHDALNKLLTPVFKGDSPAGALYSPLERFLCSIHLKKHIHRMITAEEKLKMMPSTEPGVLQFRSDYLQFRVTLNSTTYQSLHIKSSLLQESMDWTQEELEILDKFFESKVACPPFRIHAMTSFMRLLTASAKVLKDLVQLMRLEMQPERQMKWSIQWCLTIPPGAPPVAAPGCAAVVVRVNKIVFHIQLSRLNLSGPTSADPFSITVPVLYDMTTNVTSMVELQQRIPNAPPPTQAVQAIQGMLRRYAEYNHKPADCSIYPAIAELLSNLNV